MYQPILAVESSAYLMPVAPVLGNNVLLSGSIGRSFSALGCSLQSRWNLERAVDEEAFFQQAESLLFFCVGDLKIKNTTPKYDLYTSSIIDSHKFNLLIPFGYL